MTTNIPKAELDKFRRANKNFVIYHDFDTDTYYTTDNRYERITNEQSTPGCAVRCDD